MAAPTNPCYVKILLANSEPSTHGGGTGSRGRSRSGEKAANGCANRLFVPNQKVPASVVEGCPRGARLVSAHHSAVTGDVGRQDGS